jgi:hypothetical protein
MVSTDMIKGSEIRKADHPIEPLLTVHARVANEQYSPTVER